MIIRQDGDLAATSLETHSDSQPTLAFRVCRGWALVWRDVVTGIPLWAADMAMLTACWWVVAVVMAWWSLSTPQVMTGPYWTFVISTCFAYWLLGQYPAVCVNPIVETRRCMQGIGMSVVTLAMASLLMVETSSAAVASQLIFVSVLACLALPAGRIICRSLLSQSVWWRQTVKIVGDDVEVEKYSAWTEQCGELGIRLISDTDLDRRPEYLMVTPRAWRSGDITQDDLILSIPRAILLSEENPFDLLSKSEKAAILCREKLISRLHAPHYQFCKRAFDVVLVLALSPILLSLIAAIFLLIRMSSGGPVFYGQWRPGKDGKRFRAWKFRSMELDAETRLKEHLDASPHLRTEWEANGKLENDPRVTKFGRFLRQSSLDELPQVWNVLIGEMSLVGPRPILMSQLPHYESFELYCALLPGITGLWQISGRSNTTFPERMACDAYYVRNWSPWFDIYLLLRTVRTVSLQEGAY